MSTAGISFAPPQPQARFRRLVAAEVLKLRRRPPLALASLLLLVAPVVVSLVVLAVLHAANPASAR